ncbi:MAG: hypothetical protein WC140_05220 [Bacteroidales bacterium]
MVKKNVQNTKTLKSDKIIKTNKNIKSDVLRRRLFIRKYKKSIRFNSKEIELIDNYCEEFGVKSQSSFFRDCIIENIMEQLDENYPKLF